MGAPDILQSPSPPHVVATAASHRIVAERERRAWQALCNARSSMDADSRSACFDEWVSANQALRDAQSMQTSSVISKAMDEMRGCAELLAKTTTAFVPIDRTAAASGAAPSESFTARPSKGQVFRGRGLSMWTILDVTEDVLEPVLFLVQIESKGTHADAIHDVYCEDWTLFCLVHGLSPLHNGSH